MSNPAPNGRAPLSWLLALGVPLIVVSGVVFGVIALGNLARDHLGDRNRIDFAAIECPAPPGMSRTDFLGEVQYLAGLPDRLEPSNDLVKKLFTAFAHHPWVAEVTEIKLLQEQRVRVGLRFRTPVLAVEQSGMKHAVDRNGIRLPDAAATEGLPVLRPVGPPHGPAGTLWGDERVTAAAQTVAFVRTDPDRLALSEVAGTEECLELKMAGAKIVWGHAPGSESAGEATAERKRQRLLEMEKPAGKIDLRRME